MRMLGEFELIDRYFKRAAASNEGGAVADAGRTRRVALGIGDDCALLVPSAGHLLAISSDMLVEGRHFVSTVAPERLGHKALAVNLSDLAACGASPVACTLALALPAVDEPFLAGFAKGLFALADAHGCELIGGDTTRGPLTIAITVFGEVPTGAALLRSGARAGDDLYVSGTVGDARLALEVLRGAVALEGDGFERVRLAMELPEPRVALGIALRGVASSAIDVSDGLLGDLAHVLARSNVGATVDADAVPRSAIMQAQTLALQRLCTLSGGDDYELVFTAPPAHAAEVMRAAQRSATRVTRIGRVERDRGLRVVDHEGHAIELNFTSFDHFR